jgi:hypothetical protein
VAVAGPSGLVGPLYGQTKTNRNELPKVSRKSRG